MCIYIYIYIEREREREQHFDTRVASLLHFCTIMLIIIVEGKCNIVLVQSVKTYEMEKEGDSS